MERNLAVQRTQLEAENRAEVNPQIRLLREPPEEAEGVEGGTIGEAEGKSEEGVEATVEIDPEGETAGVDGACCKEGVPSVAVEHGEGGFGKDLSVRAAADRARGSQEQEECPEPQQILAARHLIPPTYLIFTTLL